MRTHLLLVSLIAYLSIVVNAKGVPTAQTASCGTYLEHRTENNPDQSTAYAMEVRGYLSGFNMGTSGKPTTSIPDRETVLAYMDKYCHDHPLDFMQQGMFALRKDLGGTR